MSLPADPARAEVDLPYAGFGWGSALHLLMESLPSALVAPHEKEALSTFAAALPGTWHWGMFETRLGHADAPVDVLSAMVQLPETRKQLTDLFSSGGHPALDPARGPLSAWARSDGSRYAESPNLWLEWDRDRPGAPPLPWLCIAPDFFSRHLSPLRPNEIGELAAQFMSSDPELEVPGAQQCLVRLAQSLPKGGKLMGFSSLKPRGKEVCRVFARLPQGTMAAWLSEIGWQGNRAQLLQSLPLFHAEGEHEWCQIEFTDRVGAYLAIEMAQTERGFPGKEARLRWLNQVVDRGFADKQKADAVLKWHGPSDCSLPGTPPVRLLRSFHLKLTFSETAAPLAKAYLGFYFRKQRRAQAAREPGRLMAHSVS